MSEKKPGLFGRLFGRKPKPETVAEDAPAVVNEPGPPETLPEFVEHAHAPEADPAPTQETPPAADSDTLPHASPAPPEMTIEPAEHVEDAPAEVEPIEAPNETSSIAEPEAVAGVLPEPEPEPEKKNWFQRMAGGLKRTSDSLTENIGAVFTKKKLDAATLEELEDVLIQADLGIDTAMNIADTLRQDRFDKEISTEDVRAVLANEVQKVLAPVAQPLVFEQVEGPTVVLMIGVNGSGKTTTIGKLAQKYSQEGKKVMLAAGDTFRAAAIEQLQVWGERTNTPVITRPAGADASGLAFDAVTEATEQGMDLLIIDTAGRLQNRDELMAELEKVIRVIKKVNPNAPHKVLLTLDATTGQNALQQVEIFGKRAGVTGLVMTKLDGTARGGILVAIAQKFALPVHFIGVGEGVDDLEPFSADDFAKAISG